MLIQMTLFKQQSTPSHKYLRYLHQNHADFVYDYLCSQINQISIMTEKGHLKFREERFCKIISLNSEISWNSEIVIQNSEILNQHYEIVIQNSGMVNQIFEILIQTSELVSQNSKKISKTVHQNSEIHILDGTFG